MFKKSQKLGKKSVISFDYLICNDEPVQVQTMYNVFNTLYSNEQVKRLPNTMIDIYNRRMSLEAIFANRVIFLLENVIRNTGVNYVGVYAEQLKHKYPFIFDIYSYMANITESTLLDYTNIICSEIYNNTGVCDHREASTFKEGHEAIMKDMQKFMMAILTALQVAKQDALNIYYPAGAPEMEDDSEPIRMQLGERE